MILFYEGVVMIKRKDGMKRGVVLLPNLITTANLFCGFFSIVQTLQGKYVFAVWLVILAGFFDFLDGRVARMTNSQSDFGMEYDSLSDLTTFCLAPAILIYTWGMAGFGKYGIAAAFIYFTCGALRLARYNVQAQGVEKSDFQGLPSPAAAGTMVSFVLFHQEFFGSPHSESYFILFLAATVGLLMVSNFRYRSLKKVNRKRINIVYLVGIVASLFLILSRPDIMLFPSGLIYIAYGIVTSIFFSTREFHRQSQIKRKNRPQGVRKRHFRRRKASQNIQQQQETDTSRELEHDNVYKFSQNTES